MKAVRTEIPGVKLLTGEVRDLDEGGRCIQDITIQGAAQHILFCQELENTPKT